MAICAFCGSDVARGQGILYVKKDGTTFLFCASKCRKNQLGLKREGRRQKWTVASRKFKEMTAVRAKKK
ncbi:MAG: 50S ribosomal protein L24e [Candidatus Micrarchaeota archaeon]